MSFEDYQELSRVYLEYQERQFPTFPGKYIVDVHDRVKGTRPSNTLENCIIRYLNWSGNQAENIKNTGTYRDGRYHYGRGTPGTADISATIRGRSVKIEVKYGKDKQSEAQEKYQQRIEQSGGLYWIVRDFREFLTKYYAL